MTWLATFSYLQMVVALCTCLANVIHSCLAIDVYIMICLSPDHSHQIEYDHDHMNKHIEFNVRTACSCRGVDNCAWYIVAVHCRLFVLLNQSTESNVLATQSTKGLAWVLNMDAWKFRLQHYSIEIPSSSAASACMVHHTRYRILRRKTRHALQAALATTVRQKKLSCFPRKNKKTH